MWKVLDCDSDGLTNEQELQKNTDPKKPDTDGDGVKDGKESTDNTNPTDPCSLIPASITLTPNAAWGNLDCDGDGNNNSSDPAPFVATARDDNASVNEGEVLTINVLDNDDFKPGPGITLSRTGGTAQGTVEFGDPAGKLLPGQLSYTPNPGANGVATIGYKVCKDEVCATAFVNVDVIVADKVEVPKVITPNGDGFNDVLEVKGLAKYPNNELVIFNRWGSEVFRAAPYINDWDGRSIGKLTLGKGADAKVPVGTYFYILKLEKGKEISGYIYVAY